MKFRSASHILIRHDEISLKGKNRKDFELRLSKNITRVVFKPVEQVSGRFVIKVNPTEIESIVKKLRQIPGIHSVAPCIVLTEKSFELIKEVGQSWFLSEHADAKVFAIRTKRVDKTFSHRSAEVDAVISDSLRQTKPNLKLQLKNPEVSLKIEIRQKAVFIYSECFPGLSGQPIDGKRRVVCLLSGGIDSPVSVFEIMKRGCSPVLIHFHSMPFTSQAAIDKVIKLARLVTEKSGYPVELHLVPLLDIQKIIRDRCNPRYRILLYRRMMVRIAAEIAQKTNASALVTGESLGQVASQTLTNLATIESAVRIPIFRPLLCHSKHEIVEKAKENGSYELSLLPYDDTCQLFAPPKVATQSSEERILPEEEKLPIFDLLFKAIDNSQKIVLSDRPKKKTKERVNAQLSSQEPIQPISFEPPQLSV
ncbi:MAG: tRNA uracil 4-sulfurtransferase ThiI [Bacteriovoracia bacterium]